MNRLKEVLDSPGPHVAVVVTELASENHIDLPAETVDVVELRIDKFTKRSVGAIEETCEAYGHMPILATVRIREEGGEWEETEHKRRALLKSILPMVDGIDVELDAQHYMKNVTKIARDTGKVAIFSYHDFDGTPTADVLEGLRQVAYMMGSDYFKVATTTNTRREFLNLANFVGGYSHDEDIIAVGMGTYGPLSRIVLPALGSRLTYASVSEVGIVSGQMGFAETRTLLNSLYPKPLQ